LYQTFYSGHGTLLKPRGEVAAGTSNIVRWRNDTFDDIVEATLPLSPEDPQFEENVKQLWTIFYEELPVIPNTSPMNWFFANTHYWTNWPTCNGEIVDGKLIGSDPSQLYAWPYQLAWSPEPHLFNFNLKPTSPATPTEADYTLYIVAAAVIVVVIIVAIWIVRSKKKL
jgi:hypothetical protein